MTGYHYTSHNNWLSIQKEGFIPYPINKPELEGVFDHTIRGIWVWAQRPTGKPELGSVLYQTSVKCSTRIVLLEVKYYENDRLCYEDRPVTLFHDGLLGSWLYHKNQAAHIIIKAIPPKHVRKIKEFNLMDLVV